MTRMDQVNTGAEEVAGGAGADTIDMEEMMENMVKEMVEDMVEGIMKEMVEEIVEIEEMEEIVHIVSSKKFHRIRCSTH